MSYSIWISSVLIAYQLSLAIVQLSVFPHNVRQLPSTHIFNILLSSIPAEYNTGVKI